MALSASQTVPKSVRWDFGKALLPVAVQRLWESEPGPAICSVLFQPSIMEGIQLHFSYISSS